MSASRWEALKQNRLTFHFGVRDFDGYLFPVVEVGKARKMEAMPLRATTPSIR